MLFSYLDFFVTEGWRGFCRSGLMSFVATSIVTISLVLLGVFLSGMLTANHLVEMVGSKLDVSAYVGQDLMDWKARALIHEMEQIEGIASVEFVSKETAWKKFQNDFQAQLSLSENIRLNPLPNTFVLHLKSPEYTSSVAKAVSQMSIVDEVRYSGQLAERIQLLAGTFKWVGLFFIVLLGFAMLLIIVNTIRLTVIARQADIDIMQLVGATKTFIRFPFIIEGMIIGAIGAASSFLILKFLFDMLFTKLQVSLPFIPLLKSAKDLNGVYWVTAFLGLLLGTLGGYISVSKSLKES